MRASRARAARLAGITSVTALLLGSAGCSNEETREAESARQSPPLPAEFQPACGNPGAVVEVARSGRVSHAACDLEGVTLRHDGDGLVVPPPGVGAGVSTITVVRAKNKDVEFKVTSAHTH